MSHHTLTGYVTGVGILGPGLNGWPQSRSVLCGSTPWTEAPTQLPPPQQLPAAERRRVGPSVKLTLAAGLEAVAQAGLEASALPAVFSSSGGDGQNCHEICEVLASAERQISPTRFHNSVHNAASGYWGIATGATAASNALCAHDGSFGAGFLESLTQALIDDTSVLLLAYDSPYPQPIHQFRPIGHALCVALALSPAPGPAARARITAHLSDEAPDVLTGPLERLRNGTPAARALPLLALLAAEAPGRTVLEYLPHASLALEVMPCR